MSAQRPDQGPAAPAPGWGWVPVGGRTYAIRRGRWGAFDCLPQRPALAVDAAGRPRLGLLLTLARPPRPGEASIAPLITSGHLTLVATLDLPAEELAALGRRLGAPCVPAFLRRAAVSLADQRGVLDQVAGAGSAARFACGAALTAAQALDALLALDGGASQLRLVAEIADDGAPAIESVSLDAAVAAAGGIPDREAAVRLMVRAADGATVPAPRLVRAAPAPRGGPAPATPRALAALQLAGRTEGVLLAMSPGATVPAAALIASAATRPGGRLSAQQAWFAGNDLSIAEDAAAAPLRPLPVADDPDAAVWPDAVKPMTRWYAPGFVLVQPAPGADPDSADFAFLLRHTAPAIGPGGVRPGLAATLRFTLGVVPPAGASAAAAGGMLRQVPLGGLGVALDLPYRVAGQAAARRQRFPGAVTVAGTQLRITLELLDDWARLAYGALAFPPAAGGEPARLVVSYAFSAYVHLDGLEVQVVAGGKLLEVAVAPRPPVEPARTPVFVAQQNAVFLPHGALALRQEARLRAGPMGAAAAALARPGGIRPEGGRPEVVRPDVLIPRPPVFVPQVPNQRIATRTMAREDLVDAVLPCATLGGLYLEDSDGRRTPIGCRDALTLGEPSPRAFEEIPALKDAAFRVYRSLQQPGRFLLLPSLWRVGRYGPGVAGRAFRPMMLLYATLADDPALDRYSLVATLVADVGAARLARLRAALAGLAPAWVAPDLVLPTDPFVAAETRFAWAVPGGMAAPQTLAVADSFTLTMTMDAASALLVTAAIGQSGISGQVTFALPDGTSLAGALQLDGEVTGPAETGPVTAEVAGGLVMLQNRTAQPANVFGLVCRDAAGALREVPVGTTLAAGATQGVPVAAEVVGEVASALADARMAAPAPIETLDLFVEDIVQRVLFINQINFANHAITALAVLARIAGLGEGQQQPLAEGASLTLTFTLPVTAYLDQRKLEFALAVTTPAGTTTTPWRARALSASAVVGLTPDLL